ncbi:Cleavage and polyadenylation specificity factor subunit 6 [Chytriomyces hyalinus]|nr:Cleavage and polyadenylation specificity factor subunit 6 [Chytriomyces hyalinus]
MDFDIYGDTVDYGYDDDLLGPAPATSTSRQIEEPKKEDKPDSNSSNRETGADNKSSSAANIHVASVVPGITQTDHFSNLRALNIDNLTWWTTDEDLYLASLDAGIHKDSLTLEDITFLENRGNGKSRGSAQIAFKSNKDALVAKAFFDKIELHGNKPVTRVSYVDANKSGIAGIPPVGAVADAFVQPPIQPSPFAQPPIMNPNQMNGPGVNNFGPSHPMGMGMGMHGMNGMNGMNNMNGINSMNGMNMMGSVGGIMPNAMNSGLTGGLMPSQAPVGSGGFIGRPMGMPPQQIGNPSMMMNRGGGNMMHGVGRGGGGFMGRGGGGGFMNRSPAMPTNAATASNGEFVGPPGMGKSSLPNEPLAPPGASSDIPPPGTEAGDTDIAPGSTAPGTTSTGKPAEIPRPRSPPPQMPPQRGGPPPQHGYRGGPPARPPPQHFHDDRRDWGDYDHRGGPPGGWDRNNGPPPRFDPQYPPQQHRGPPPPHFRGPPPPSIPPAGPPGPSLPPSAGGYNDRDPGFYREPPRDWDYPPPPSHYHPRAYDRGDFDPYRGGPPYRGGAAGRGGGGGGGYAGDDYYRHPPHMGPPPPPQIAQRLGPRAVVEVVERRRGSVDSAAAGSRRHEDHAVSERADGGEENERRKRSSKHRRRRHRSRSDNSDDSDDAEERREKRRKNREADEGGEGAGGDMDEGEDKKRRRHHKSSSSSKKKSGSRKHRRRSDSEDEPVADE